MTQQQKVRINVIQQHFTMIDRLIASLDSEISSMIEPYSAELKLLCTIPGVDHDITVSIVSEIGADMEQFGNSKRLCIMPPGTIAYRSTFLV